MTLPASFLHRPIAHRGLHGVGAPENSMAAFRAAAEQGFGIELDVQPDAEGVAMVFHDATLDRMTAQSGPIDAYPAADLARMHLAGTAEGIPRLRDVLAMVDGRVPVLIEVKDRDGAMGPDLGPLEQGVVAALDGYDGEVAVMSFNPHSVARLRDLAPHLPRGLTTSNYEARHWPELPPATRARLRAIPDYERLDCCFISHQGDALDMARVADLKTQGAAILCWTIRSAAQEALARQVADNVTFEGYLP